MNQLSPTISPEITDLCNLACELIEAGDYQAACGIQTALELSSDFGAAFAAQIIQLKIFFTIKSRKSQTSLSAMPVQGGVQ